MTDQEIHSIGGLNKLSESDRLDHVRLLIPPALFERYHINPDTFADEEGCPLVNWVGAPGTTSVEFSLYHQHAATDPLMYFHITDTISLQLHILLAVVNDPDSPRFDVDRMPDGSKTHFGIFKRNLEAEVAAMQAGLAPGQIRRGFDTRRRQAPLGEERLDTAHRLADPGDAEGERIPDPGEGRGDGAGQLGQGGGRIPQPFGRVLGASVEMVALLGVVRDLAVHALDGVAELLAIDRHAALLGLSPVSRR